MNMNNSDPIKPPKIVISLLDASCILNVCIPAKITTDKMAARAHDDDGETAPIH